MPIKLTPSFPPWARLKVSTGNLAFGVPGGDTGEVRFAGLQLAIDFERSLPGWLHITENGPDFVPGLLNHPLPIQPSSEHVPTLMLHLWSPKVLGDRIYTICDKSAAYRTFVEEQYNACEPLFGEGKIPLFKILETPIVQMSRGASIEILSMVETWIKRPPQFDKAIAVRDANIAFARPRTTTGSATADDHQADSTPGPDPTRGEPPTDGAPPITENEIDPDTPF